MISPLLKLTQSVAPEPAKVTWRVGWVVGCLMVCMKTINLIPRFPYIAREEEREGGREGRRGKEESGRGQEERAREL